jgi:hypothetical protein
MKCIREIELPRFITARHVPNGGSVMATIELGKGTPRIEVRSAQSEKSLEAEVKYHLTEKTKYVANCVGRFELRFVFAVEGEPTFNPYARVFFRPPNEFVIITQPLRPSIDVIPLKE